MAREKKKPYSIKEIADTLEIHLTGDLLHDQVFLQIVEIMKANRECEQPKKVRFFVTTSMMMMSVRYAIPSKFYESIELEDAVTADRKGALRDAAGL